MMIWSVVTYQNAVPKASNFIRTNYIPTIILCLALLLSRTLNYKRMVGTSYLFIQNEKLLNSKFREQNFCLSLSGNVIYS